MGRVCPCGIKSTHKRARIPCCGRFNVCKSGRADDLDTGPSTLTVRLAGPRLRSVGSALRFRLDKVVDQGQRGLGHRFGAVPGAAAEQADQNLFEWTGRQRNAQVLQYDSQGPNITSHLKLYAYRQEKRADGAVIQFSPGPVEAASACDLDDDLRRVLANQHGPFLQDHVTDAACRKPAYQRLVARSPSRWFCRIGCHG